MVRISAMKRFDDHIGYLGVTAAPTRWVRVVADVNTIWKRFQVVTCYPAYYNAAELKKKGTHYFKAYTPICICHNCAGTLDSFLDAIVSNGKESRQSEKLCPNDQKDWSLIQFFMDIE